MDSRDVIFVSHSNPEDNRFARWLTLRIAREGYRTWCDVTRLLGGEDFWKEIEKTLRTRTAKFIYVLSRTSNTKDGPLNELAIARQVARSERLEEFVIPALIDDLPHGEINIELKRINAIDFSRGWASGLPSLFQQLARSAVPRMPGAGPGLINQWWRATKPGKATVISDSDTYDSNCFELRVPPSIFAHTLKSEATELRIGGEYPYPAAVYGERLISFAPDADFRGRLPLDRRIVDSSKLATSSVLNGEISLPVPNTHDTDARKRPTRQQANNLVTDIVQQGFRRLLLLKGLVPYEMSAGEFSFYFPAGLIEDDTVRAVELGLRRQVVGYRTIASMPDPKIRHWHFAISGKPRLADGLWLARSHALFSDDGTNVWPDPERMHKARRRDCRNWWNDRWRDLLLGTMAWLGSDGKIEVPLGSNVNAEILSSPVPFVSLVSYEAPSDEPPDDRLEYEDDDEDDSINEEQEDGAR
jgi:hypothetical protein